MKNMVEKKIKVYGWARHDYSLSHFNQVDKLEQIEDVFNLAIKKKFNNLVKSSRCELRRQQSK